MKILNIIEAAFRGTIEEQDDTVVWTVHAMKNAGQASSVLLRGNAVCHATVGQDTTGLRFGDWSQKNPVDLTGDLEKLMAAGVEVYVVQDDLGERGLEGSDLIGGLKPIPQSGIAALCDQHDIVWHW